MPVLACPKCRKRLARRATLAGDVNECRRCGGRLAGIAVLRKERAAADFLKESWRLARERSARRGRPCPACARRMSVVTVHVGRDDPGAGEIEIDVCPLCASVWFDAGEYAAVPHEAGHDAGDKAPPGTETASRPEGPRSAWQYLPAVLGMPIETGAQAVAKRPLVTWGAAALAAVVFAGAAGLGMAEELVRLWGFVPDRWDRLGGATLVTSFFVHAGLLHLAANLYFLLVFGDNVEERLGRARFLLLLLCAHVMGVAVHGAFDPRGTLPLVGASAAVSGVVAYYAAAFPRARLAILLFFLWWVSLPAWMWFALWIAMQFLGATYQVAGFSNVSSLAHLGGAAVGLIAAFGTHEGRKESLRLAGVRHDVK